MKKLVAAAAVGMAALALHSAPAPAATSTGEAAFPPVDRVAHRDAGKVGMVPEALVTPPSHDVARRAPEPTGVHLAGSAQRGPARAAARLAASGVAVLMWAAVTAGLIALRSRWTGPVRRTKRRGAISDEELRELVGIRPRVRPAT